MNCYQCAEKEKCELRRNPELQKYFHCKDMDKEEPKKEHAGNPAQINYLPICSECGEVIPGEVKTIRTIGAGIDDYEINPETCPNCGAVFNGVTVFYPTFVELDERGI